MYTYAYMHTYTAEVDGDDTLMHSPKNMSCL